MMDIVHSKARPTPRWRPTPLTAVSMLAARVRAAAVLMLPETWPFAVGALAGNHLLLGVAGMQAAQLAAGSQPDRACPRRRRRAARSH